MIDELSQSSAELWLNLSIRFSSIPLFVSGSKPTKVGHQKVYTFLFHSNPKWTLIESKLGIENINIFIGR